MSLRVFSAVLVIVCASAQALAQTNSCNTGDTYFAAQIASYVPGPGVTAGVGFGISSRLLCVPSGSSDVVTLGVGGSITASFDVPIVDGPGIDFIAWENTFAFAGLIFAELAFCEVSTDGISFARFPAQYFGPNAPVGAFAGIPAGSVKNLVGLGRLFSQGFVEGYVNPCVAGGDAFDLAELAGDPLVLSGAVDLANIQFARFIDILGDGTTLDANGAAIRDATNTTNSADLDAIAVVNHALNQSIHRPSTAVSFDSSTRRLTISLGDADTIFDLTGPAFMTINEIAVDLNVIAPLFPTMTFTATTLDLESLPVPLGLTATVCVFVSDATGLSSSDSDLVTP
jgi:hypothetical protein